MSASSFCLILCSTDISEKLFIYHRMLVPHFSILENSIQVAGSKQTLFQKLFIL